MGTTLTGTTPANTYDSLIKVTDNGPLSGTAKYLSDGLGNDSVLAISTGAIGIGTNSLFGKFNLADASNARLEATPVADGVSFEVLDSARANPLDFKIYANDILFNTKVSGSYSERLRITSAGNVGIGTSSPNAPLEILSNAAANAIRLRARTADDYSFIQFANNASSEIVSEIFSQRTGANIARLGFSTANGAGSIERMTISSAGNVGIGTSSPDVSLTVKTGANAGISKIYSDGNGAVYSSNGDLQFYTNNSAYAINFFSANKAASLLKITNGGNVGIGTASPSAKLHISENATNSSINVNHAVDSGTIPQYAGISFGAPSTALGGDVRYTGGAGIQSVNTQVSGNETDLRFWTTTGGGPTERMRILAGGGLTFNGDTAAANALDDYEEGTFTPTVTGATSAGSTTYVRQYGWYTKIGRQVTINLFVDYTAMTGTGTLRIGGLPFPIGNYTDFYTVGSVIVDELNWTGGTFMQALGVLNSSYMWLVYMSDDAGSNVQNCVNESAAIRITMTYFV